MVQDGLRVSRNLEEVEPSWGQEGYNLWEADLVDEEPPGFRASGSRWSIESHTSISVLGEFTLTLEDVVELTLLPSFEEANMIGIVLEGAH